MKLLVTVISLVAFLRTPINANVGMPEGRILKGDDVYECEKYPWNAQISYFCGGSLITNKYVLTAAHCTNNCIVGEEYPVLLGSTRSGSGKKYLGRLKACHNEYKGLSPPDPSYYDIAIVELTVTVEKTPCINIINIFGRDQTIPEDLSVTSIGFGKTENKDRSSILQEATDLRTINLNSCESVFRLYYNSHFAHICTKAEISEQNTCRGDSGSSLFYEDANNEVYLLGINSFGPRVCLGGVSVFTRLNHPKVISWIRKMTK